ncbi:L-dopachrome tautomerase-related protein [Prolixibacteraceae bacterium]|nr:L-dopachrome tautomerase-related protein [Prolixibacteraceae bacterium]
MDYFQKFFYLLSKSILLFLAIITVSCGQKETIMLEEMGSSANQWTGVAVSNKGRIFVNYPRWSQDVPISVAEIIRGDAMPFPDLKWNTESKDHFIAVQSVFIDLKDRLWVLDTRNPKFRGVLDGGPVLFCFNLSNNSLISKYDFPSTSYETDSYFNDIRVDCDRDYAYITDSGAGALIVLDLKNREVRRRLPKHPSTKSEMDHLICNGVRWNNSVDSDGLALTSEGDYLYFIALTGYTLYRIPSAVLRDFCLKDTEVEVFVEEISKVPATDGMMFDLNNNLWLGGLERDGINMLSTNGTLVEVIKDSRIKWADSFAIDKNGFIYFTTSQIYLKEEERSSYKVYRFLSPNRGKR